MDDMQKEIWHEMVSTMNHALSNDCMKEMQARNVLKIR
ncbi:Uncharacterized protein BM_BM281 [Brugia malayi]|uniref:Bm281 n=1 Tax=Brugia malayi TaxID=6279 RepID=A0A0J9XNV9_BRUMA|nr:Uncharacterized protein BM_BM281 [Brugia malayi]CDP92443.1 Bm281 [Brugia malayi]VIO95554.1 Uncharacterized protein BM_BM281 [Brugia malayi]